LKWENCRGRYKAFISLGSTCQTAHQLRRLGLRRFAGPLDWFISPSIPDLTKLLRFRFKGFMEGPNLQLIGTAQNYFVVKDTAYQVESYHDFPITVNPAQWADPYHQFKEKIDRRVEHFLKAVDYSPICFVRIQTSKAEARSLRDTLTTIVNKPFHLLIVNLHSDGTQYVVHEDWGLKRISSVMVPAGWDWRGSDQAWDMIMKGFSL
jgi:hypothetical protein